MTSISKFVKYRICQKDSVVARALPTTYAFNANNLRSALDRFNTVIVKPSFGYGGEDVMKLSKTGNNRYLLQAGMTKQQFNSFSAVIQHLKKKVKTRAFIIQRYIHLASVQGRPMDIRVMVQRKPGGLWTVTGKLAKIAGQGHLITNVQRSGGYVLPLSTALARAFGTASKNTIAARVDNVSLKIAQLLGEYYKTNIVGLDIGVDSNQKIWLIEPNFTPDNSLFLRLKDKSMFYRIISYRRNSTKKAMMQSKSKSTNKK